MSPATPARKARWKPDSSQQPTLPVSSQSASSAVLGIGEPAAQEQASGYPEIVYTGGVGQSLASARQSVEAVDSYPDVSHYSEQQPSSSLSPLQGENLEETQPHETFQ